MSPWVAVATQGLRRSENMTWRRWGLKASPYTLNPIDETELDLFVGRSNEIKHLQHSFSENKCVVFLEGNRGVGKTAVGNYWRYDSMRKRLCFTPFVEIGVNPMESFYLFITALIEAINWSLPQSVPFILRDPDFKKHESRSREFFDSVRAGVAAGGSLNDVEDQYLYKEAKDLLENISNISPKSGCEYGTIIQLSFATLNHSGGEKGLSEFRKKIWGVFAVHGFKWLLTGPPLLDTWLYHADVQVQTKDMDKIAIQPLELAQVYELLQRRKDYLGLNQNAKLPLALDVIEYLYSLSDGNLTRVFPLCATLAESQDRYQSMPELNLEVTKPLIVKHFKDESQKKWQLTPAAIEVLKFLVRDEGLPPSAIADRMKRLRPNISKILMHLKQRNLVRMEIRGRNQIYYPCMEAKIAFA